jgi:hypothetical protein
MTFLCWLQGSRKPVQPGRGCRFRPVLEQLEDRWAPAQVSNLTGIFIPPIGTAAPYPSKIEVSGFAGAVSKVTVMLHDFFDAFAINVDILLVAPNGANAIIMSDVGGGVASVVGTLTLDDAAAAPLPENGPLLTPGTFRPTNVGSGDTFPAPAPIPSGGSALSVFNGSNPNGTWRLFVVDDDDGLGTPGGGIQGWTLILQGPSVTTVSAAPNPAPFGQAVTLTATVTGQGTPAGTVTFRDGDAVLGTAPLRGGQASLTVRGLRPGAHALTAAYDGNAEFQASTSAALGLLVNDQITAERFQKKGVARVRVRAATTQTVRATLTPFRGFGGRLRLQLQDVNGDGVLDLIVQAVIHGKRKKKVFDAVTLALLPSAPV